MAKPRLAGFAGLATGGARGGSHEPMRRPWSLPRRALAASGLALALLSLSCSGDGARAFTDFKALSTGISRPPATAQGDVVAYLVASDGALTIRDRGGAEVPATAGMPLLADDTLTPAKEALALVLLHNGYTVRVDGGVTLRIDGLAVFASPPATQSIEDQLRASLSSDQRARLGDAGERIGGWQLRRTALDGMAPEEMPAAEPAAAPAPIEAASEDQQKKEDRVAEEIDRREAPGTGDRATQGAKETPEIPEPEEVGAGGGASGEPKADGKRSSSARSQNKAPEAKPAPPQPSTPRPKSEPTPADLDDDGPQTDAGAQRGSKVPTDEEKAAAWRLGSSTWTAGAGDKAGASLIAALSKCLSQKTGSTATVVLTITGDRATALTVDGAKHDACLTAVRGLQLRGAGTLQVKLTR